MINEIIAHDIFLYNYHDFSLFDIGNHIHLEAKILEDS